MALHVGLSGGIGSGKSTVSRLLVERGAVLVDSDAIARAVVEPGTEGLALIRERFGDEVISDDGSLDRPALAATVFGDDAARADLNAIVHPRVAQEAVRQVEAAPDDAIVVQDIPLLVELGREVDYHLAVIVAADPDVRLERLVRTRGMGEAEVRSRMAAQATDEQRRAAADVWLPNEGTEAELTALVDALWTERLVPFEGNLRSRTAVRRPATAALHEPDPDWAPTARRLLGRLDRALRHAGLEPGPDNLQHIGSTSVPGLVAKDVIDLQLTLDDLTRATAPDVENALLSAGFVQPRERLDTVHEWAPDEGSGARCSTAAPTRGAWSTCTCGARARPGPRPRSPSGTGCAPTRRRARRTPGRSGRPRRSTPAATSALAATTPPRRSRGSPSTSRARWSGAAGTGPAEPVASTPRGGVAQERYTSVRVPL
ncbi:dephospho-CoA kinase [Barrientosiimonas endolithica]|uniref:Dephospho-CoA kinase n=1 Tax=Barrientosiimonas endolithica TaxID=1535208 RepID=A0ABM8HBL3_9MICO|nr:hypothetical protein GCM10025872_18410 [Barrientosiimonas endolithica]